jgi:hypothetical protein
VPFSVVLAIADRTAQQPVFDAMTQSLQAMGVQIADTRTAPRIVAVFDQAH